ncbi:phosphotransferase family protein [Nocardia fluminea]|uniref:phosphotransferase family protein n=1 Tax=Nocardia fluminea TaxID=134984 RepID=UPI0033F3C11C
MEQAPEFSKGRDLDAAISALRPWLAARRGAAVDIEEARYPRGAGFSNETILITTRTAQRVEDFVVRIAPSPEHQVYYEPRFHLQFDILTALYERSDVLVPQPLWFEQDTAILGRPFYAMHRMHGRVPISMPGYNSTGWLADAAPAERRTLWDSAMRQLCAIHQVPASAVSFVDRPEHGPAGDTQHLSYWRSYIDWAFEDEVPLEVMTLMDWLTAHRPPASAPRLSWGDARIGNIMFGNDFRVVGVMDWEQVSLACPLSDLAWWLLFDDALSVGQGVPRLDGLGSRAETIAMWQELTGYSIDHLHWHEVFASVKAGLISLRSRRSMRIPESTSTRRFDYLGRACELAEVATPEQARR